MYGRAPKSPKPLGRSSGDRLKSRRNRLWNNALSDVCDLRERSICWLLLRRDGPQARLTRATTDAPRRRAVIGPFNGERYESSNGSGSSANGCSSPRGSCPSIDGPGNLTQYDTGRGGSCLQATREDSKRGHGRGRGGRIVRCRRDRTKPSEQPSTEEPPDPRPAVAIPTGQRRGRERDTLAVSAASGTGRGVAGRQQRARFGLSFVGAQRKPEEAGGCCHSPGPPCL